MHIRRYFRGDGLAVKVGQEYTTNFYVREDVLGCPKQDAHPVNWKTRKEAAANQPAEEAWGLRSELGSSLVRLYKLYVGNKAG